MKKPILKAYKDVRGNYSNPAVVDRFKVIVFDDGSISKTTNGAKYVNGWKLKTGWTPAMYQSDLIAHGYTIISAVSSDAKILCGEAR